MAQLPGHTMLMLAGQPPNTRGYPVTPRDVSELTDHTPKGYSPLILLENASYRIRECSSPVAFWMLRLLVDGVLLLSCIANFEGSSRAHALQLAGKKKDDDEGQLFYHERFSKSLKQLTELLGVNQEDALLSVHWTLDTLASADPLEGDYSQLDTLAKRLDWERWAFGAMAEITNTTQVSSKLRDLKIRLQEGTKEDQKRVLEAITETVDPELASGAKDGGDYRRTNLPALWRMRTAITLSDMKQRFLADGRAAAQYPSLALLITEEELLRCITALPYILAWKATVEQHFNKRIDRQTAESRNINRVLQELPADMRRQWTLLFEKFAEGWNRVRSYINGHDAEKGLVLVEMTERVSNMHVSSNLSTEANIQSQ